MWCGSNYEFGNQEVLKCDHLDELLSRGAVYYALHGVLAFESVDEILRCDHSNESYWAVPMLGQKSKSSVEQNKFW